MIEMPITLEPYESYINRLIEETHKMVREMHDIVRCKDCKYMFIEGKTTKFYYCNKFASSVDETGYCAWGEKK